MTPRARTITVTVSRTDTRRETFEFPDLVAARLAYLEAIEQPANRYCVVALAIDGREVRRHEPQWRAAAATEQQLALQRLEAAVADVPPFPQIRAMTDWLLARPWVAVGMVIVLYGTVICLGLAGLGILHP